MKEGKKTTIFILIISQFSYNKRREKIFFSLKAR